MNSATIKSIHRYPVKGLSPDELDSVEVCADQGLPFDRSYAIENGTHDFDPINPKYFPKAKFLQLMSNEQLAALETTFDPQTQTLKVLRNGKQVAAGNLSLPIGRQLLEQFFVAYLGSAARGTPRVVSADNHHFADVPDNFISLINLASVRDLERVAGRPVDPLRFRGNIYVDGWEPWAEMSLTGHMLSTPNGVTFTVVEPITRCAAINVDPSNGNRDMQLPRLLSDVFGHECCGLYLSALSDGKLSVSDTLEIGAKQSADRNLGI